MPRLVLGEPQANQGGAAEAKVRRKAESAHGRGALKGTAIAWRANGGVAWETFKGRGKELWGGGQWIAMAAREQRREMGGALAVDVDVVVVQEAVSSVESSVESAVNRDDDAIRRGRAGASGGLEGAAPAVGVSHNVFGDVAIRRMGEGRRARPSVAFAGNRAGDVALRCMGAGLPRALEVGDGAEASRNR
ncbi:hypothetical protein ZWY2020_005641 [Hordeum vulgare]|nr:hypothetical protein ZWY2020_005641 [Hordeum vulgare]